MVYMQIRRLSKYSYNILECFIITTITNGVLLCMETHSASYLEQVDDERAAVTQVINDLKVVDVAVD